jgi:hypothetical protein
MIDGILRGERETGNECDEGETQRHESQLLGHDFWVLFFRLIFSFELRGEVVPGEVKHSWRWKTTIVFVVNRNYFHL